MLNINPFQPSDKAQWLPLWHQYLAFYQTNLPEHITHLTWQRLLDPEFNLWGIGIYTQNGHMLGFAHFLFHPSSWNINNYCYLEDLFVSPTERAQGLGKKLIHAVQQQADSAGAGKLYWLTQSHNASGRRLYDKIATQTDFVHYEIRQATPSTENIST